MGGLRCHRSFSAIAATITIAGSFLSQAIPGEVVPSEEQTVSNITSRSLGHSSCGRHANWGKRRRLYHVDVTEAGHPCLRSPLWNTEVDPLNYEFGCTEIKAMLKGPKTLVGNGRVRDVFLVEYGGRTVVVKTLRRMDTRRSRKKHLERHNVEVLTLDVLTGHRNIVGMLGLCDTTIVTEYYPKNFLQTILRKEHQQPILQVVSMALDAAKGLQALHEIAGGLHFDLKPQQLLVDDRGRLKLNDFNSAHIMSINPLDGTHCPAQATKRNRLTPWPSPENYAGEPLTEASDVYSLGMVFFTLISGKVPYDDDQERLETAFYSGTRPDIDPSWHRGFVKVMKAMWAEDPKRRPSTRHIVRSLQKIQEKLLGLPISS